MLQLCDRQLQIQRIQNSISSQHLPSSVNRPIVLTANSARPFDGRTQSAALLQEATCAGLTALQLTTLHLLISALSSETNANALSCEGAAWWTPRLLPVEAPQQQAGALPEWLAGRALLVTGGLGSLGVLFSLWAVQQARLCSTSSQLSCCALVKWFDIINSCL